MIGIYKITSPNNRIYIGKSINIGRRWEEYKEKGTLKNLEELEIEIIRRDESDMNRKIAPLRKAEDAILIDTSNLSKIIVINMILSRL